MRFRGNDAKEQLTAFSSLKDYFCVLNKDGTITTICYICRLFFSLKEVENDDNASESISRFRLLFVLL